MAAPRWWRASSPRCASWRELGFGTAGAEVPDYVFLLNPDTETLDDAPARLIRFLEGTPDAGMAGPRLLYPDGRLQHSSFAFPSLPQILFDFFPVHGRLLESRLNGRYPRQWYEEGHPFRVDHLLGAAMMARGEAVIYAVPEAEVIHHEGASTRQFRDRMFVTLWRSRFLLFEKWYSPWFNAIARRIVRLGLWWKTRQARRAADGGQMTPEELEGRLRAYQEVAALL